MNQKKYIKTEEILWRICTRPCRFRQAQAGSVSFRQFQAVSGSFRQSQAASGRFGEVWRGLERFGETQEAPGLSPLNHSPSPIDAASRDGRDGALPRRHRNFSQNPPRRPPKPLPFLLGCVIVILERKTRNIKESKQKGRNL